MANVNLQPMHFQSIRWEIDVVRNVAAITRRDGDGVSLIVCRVDEAVDLLQCLGLLGHEYGKATRKVQFAAMSEKGDDDGD